MGLNSGMRLPVGFGPDYNRRMLRKLFAKDRSRRPPRAPAGTRLYAIGDVHGRYDLLRRIADRISDDMRGWRGRTLTVLLGDLIDRGPQSRDVIDCLARNDFPTPFAALMGNHEAAILHALETDRALALWVDMGGGQTLASYCATDTSPAGFTRADLPNVMPEEHWSFIETMPPSLDAGDFFFCHAGIRPGVPLEHQTSDDLLWIREPFLSSSRDHGKIIVHGHTPVAAPLFLPNRIALDTGAFATGNLTCIAIEDDSIRLLSQSNCGAGEFRQIATTAP